MYVGLDQQRLGAPAASIDCDYRVDLVRDRLVSLLEQVGPPGDSRATAAGERFSNLLQDTRAICAAQGSDVARKLDRITTIFDAYHDRSRRDDQDRLELLQL
ncbi:MAG TPA: hypothetical protein PKW35_06685 [Nannocystaceae bacterium]|nr:hypothetical protein [Nannocystaceae bacterium]